MVLVHSKWPRRIERTLWGVGLVLCAVAAESTITRWHYQQQQERALFTGGPASPLRAEAVLAEPVRPATESPVTALPRSIASAPVEVKEPAVAPGIDPTAIGRIEIPRLGLKAIVKEGGDKKTLARAVGLIPGSAHPGSAGNMILAGHRDTFFWDLQDIAVGDQVRMVVPSHTYRYRVDSIHVVQPEETSLLASNGVEELTLVTCYPFRFIGPAPERFIVKASRIN